MPAPGRLFQLWLLTSRQACQAGGQPQRFREFQLCLFTAGRSAVRAGGTTYQPYLTGAFPGAGRRAASGRPYFTTLPYRCPVKSFWNGYRTLELQAWSGACNVFLDPTSPAKRGDERVLATIKDSRRAP